MKLFSLIIIAVLTIGCSQMLPTSPTQLDNVVWGEDGGTFHKSISANPLPNGVEVELWWPEHSPGATSFGAQVKDLATGQIVLTPGNVQSGYSVRLSLGRYAFRVRGETPEVGNWSNWEEFSVGLDDTAGVGVAPGRLYCNTPSGGPRAGELICIILPVRD